MLVGIAAVVAIVLCTAGAPAAVLKHKETGETIRGTITKQKINKLTVFKCEGGESKFIKLEEWKIIEGDLPEPQQPPEMPQAQPQPEPEAARKSEPEKKAPAIGYILPICGPIEHYALVEALQKGAAEAKKKGASVVIFRMDTPGGRIDLGGKIIDLIEEIDNWALTVTWVQGKEKQALSCGAYLSLATHQIYMAPGTTIGAATPYRVTWFGPEIDAKLTSAFQARFRALAEQRGHPLAIANAMVDSRESVVQVFVDDKQMLVTETEARQLEKDHESDGGFKRGKIISRPGQLITLTDREALEYELSRGTVTTAGEIMKAVGHETFEVSKADWIPDWVETQTKKRMALFEKYRATFEANLAQANYSSGTRRRKHLEEAARALAIIEKMAKDPRFGVPLRDEDIQRWKARLQAWYESER